MARWLMLLRAEGAGGAAGLGVNRRRAGQVYPHRPGEGAYTLRPRPLQRPPPSPAQHWGYALACERSTPASRRAAVGRACLGSSELLPTARRGRLASSVDSSRAGLGAWSSPFCTRPSRWHSDYSPFEVHSITSRRQRSASRAPAAAARSCSVHPSLESTLETDLPARRSPA